MRLAWGFVVCAALALGVPARADVGVDVGYGGANYDRGLNAAAELGSAWMAGLRWMPSSVVGLEAQYEGTRASYDAGNVGGLGTDGTLAQDGGSLLAHLNLGTSTVHPFLFGGLSVSRLHPDAGVPVEDQTLVGIPAGLGVELGLGSLFSLAARVRYDFQFGSELLSTSPDANREGFDRFMGFVTVGARLR